MFAATNKMTASSASVTAKGFCGTPKLSSSVGTVFRTTNAAGDGNYLSSTPVAFTNGKIDLYAYNYNGGTAFDLILTSDDDFNDGSTTRSFSVKKPRLKLNTGEVDLGIDGTEKDLGVEYYPETGSTPFAANAFDPAVYEQVMAPVFTLREEAKKEYFGFSGTQVFFKKIPTQATVRTLFGNVDVSGKNSTLFPKPALGSESTKVYYRYPSWVSNFSDINSNMFNEQMPASGPLLSTSAVIDAAECSPENFKGENGTQGCGYRVFLGNDFQSLVTEDVGASTAPKLVFGAADSQGHRTLTWSWEPSAQMLVTSIYAPWGERTIFPIIHNKHQPDGTDTVYLNSVAFTFKISYKQLEYIRLAVFHLNTDDAFCSVCSRLSADVATKVFEAGSGTDEFPAPPTFMEIHPSIIGRQYNERNWQGSEGGEIVSCGTPNKCPVNARVLACILENNPSPISLTPDSPEFQNVVWSMDMIEESRLEFVLPKLVGFGSQSGPTTMPITYYPGDDDSRKEIFQEHLPIHYGGEIIKYIYE